MTHTARPPITPFAVKLTPSAYTLTVRALDQARRTLTVELAVLTVDVRLAENETDAAGIRLRMDEIRKTLRNLILARDTVLTSLTIDGDTEGI